LLLFTEVRIGAPKGDDDPCSGRDTGGTVTRLGNEADGTQ
jgi:hypothetical protein